VLDAQKPMVDEQEGERVPNGFPEIIDGHVHIFPDGLFAAVWRWFAEHGWPIRYQMTSSEVVTFLLSRGISHIVAFQYAHKPGIARKLNRYMVEKCAEFPGRLTGLATVFPGEDDAAAIIEEAFAAGLAGLKLHGHVQCFMLNSEAMHQLYASCQTNGKPLVMHIGREPKSAAYRCDPDKLYAAWQLETVLKEYPRLKVCVPHLGIDEIHPYREMIEKYDNLWLDTAMAIANYLPIAGQIDLRRYRAERILYGSDFPNIPYAWDRELKNLARQNIPAEQLGRICHDNAAELFGLV
jgi:uncharacterized protein